jgi:hypothetical protein
VRLVHRHEAQAVRERALWMWYLLWEMLIFFTVMDTCCIFIGK